MVYPLKTLIPAIALFPILLGKVSLSLEKSGYNEACRYPQMKEVEQPAQLAQEIDGSSYQKQSQYALRGSGIYSQTFHPKLKMTERRKSKKKEDSNVNFYKAYRKPGKNSKSNQDEHAFRHGYELKSIDLSSQGTKGLVLGLRDAGINKVDGTIIREKRSMGMNLEIPTNTSPALSINNEGNIDFSTPENLVTLTNIDLSSTDERSAPALDKITLGPHPGTDASVIGSTPIVDSITWTSESVNEFTSKMPTSETAMPEAYYPCIDEVQNIDSTSTSFSPKELGMTPKNYMSTNDLSITEDSKNFISPLISAPAYNIVGGEMPSSTSDATATGSPKVDTSSPQDFPSITDTTETDDTLSTIMTDRTTDEGPSTGLLPERRSDGLSTSSITNMISSTAEVMTSTIVSDKMEDPLDKEISKTETIGTTTDRVSQSPSNPIELSPSPPTTERNYEETEATTSLKLSSTPSSPSLITVSDSSTSITTRTNDPDPEQLEMVQTTTKLSLSTTMITLSGPESSQSSISIQSETTETAMISLPSPLTESTTLAVEALMTSLPPTQTESTTLAVEVTSTSIPTISMESTTLAAVEAMTSLPPTQTESTPLAVEVAATSIPTILMESTTLAAVEAMTSLPPTQTESTLAMEVTTTSLPSIPAESPTIASEAVITSVTSTHTESTTLTTEEAMTSLPPISMESTTRASESSTLQPSTISSSATFSSTIQGTIIPELIPTEQPPPENEKICDDSQWLVCDMDTQHCKCKSGMTYDSENNICVSLLGNDCKEGSERKVCVKNAECSQKVMDQQGTCKCSQGFLPTGDDSSCLPGLDMPCKSETNVTSNSCHPDLKCSSEKCVCQDWLVPGRAGSHKCYLDIDANCSLENNDCNTFSFLNCSETSESKMACKCQDSKSQVYDKETRACVAIAGSRCMLKKDVDGRLLNCVMDSNCNTTATPSSAEEAMMGTCECVSGFENDWRGYCFMRNLAGSMYKNYMPLTHLGCVIISVFSLKYRLAHLF